MDKNNKWYRIDTCNSNNSRNMDNKIIIECSEKEAGQFYNKILDFSNGNSKGLRELVKQKLGL